MQQRQTLQDAEQVKERGRICESAETPPPPLGLIEYGTAAGRAESVVAAHTNTSRKCTNFLVYSKLHTASHPQVCDRQSARICQHTW